MESIWPPPPSFPPRSWPGHAISHFLHYHPPTSRTDHRSLFPVISLAFYSRDPSRKDGISYPNSLSRRSLPPLSQSLFPSLAWQKVARKGRNETREIFPFLSRDESEIEYHLAYLEMVFARHLIFTNGESKRGYIYIYIGFSSMHLGRSEHRVTLPVMRTAVKRKGYIIPTKPDLYTPSPPPRCHRKLVFHGVAACGDVSESRYYEGAAAPLPPHRILSSDPPPFVSLSPPPCFSSLPRPRKEFVITRRIV